MVSTRRLAAIFLLLCCACACSGSKGRVRNVHSARASASRGGVRQAQEFAAAVDTAFRSGDYTRKPDRGVADAEEAMRAIDRAMPMAGVDGPTLVAWRAVMLRDTGRFDDAAAEFRRSFEMGPNELAGTTLIDSYTQVNRPDLAGPVCARTVPILRTSDEKLALIARCRKGMNALSPEGEMAWMTPEVRGWYQAETARRADNAIDAAKARSSRAKQETRAVRGMQQCAATCREEGLYCQNRCYRDDVCERRCVGINKACLDRCESRAHDALDP